MDILPLLDHLVIGLGVALTPTNLLFCFIGVFLGTLIGVLPGIGSLATISMLFPITFHLEPTTALIMLAGIFYGSAYGGSITAILLNLPGQASSTVACLDGYPLARQGRAGVALLLTACSSFVGGSIGIILMMLFSPIVVLYAYDFGSEEYFSLMVLGLIAASTITSGSPAKSVAMVIVGILLGLVGVDIYSGVSRFDFGIEHLYDGISLTAIAMGLFGISEVIVSSASQDHGSLQIKQVSFRSMVPTADDRKRFWKPTLRGTAIGSFFGTLPGTGAIISSFLAYTVEKRISKEPERFGQGALEGIISSEAANNAADQTAFIPTMTLGVPGSASMALLIGIMMIHGVVPGPTMIGERPEVFWGLVMSFWVGNVLLMVLNLPLIGIWIKLLAVPYHLLYPAILLFVCIGAFSVNNNYEDVLVVAAFGALGHVVSLLGFNCAPLILGFVLGPMLEQHFRRAMLLSHGDPLTFFYKPFSGAVLAIALCLLVWGLWKGISGRSKDLSDD
jgi:TctA family transporter